jgi:hypothetical protein
VATQRRLKATVRIVLRGLLYVLAVACATVHASTRIAVVVGNAAYVDAPLSNPTNDASAVGKALERLGFTVIHVRDGTKSQMEQSINRARELLTGKNGVGLLYYAGHALQLEWRNYLVPVDARLGSPRDVAAQTIDVQQVLDVFKAAGNRMNIIVLDACRNNPFGATGRGLGLAQMDAPWGTFLAFSTAPGNVAEDGTSDRGNSLYTHYLVQELGQPKSRIEDVFKRVRVQVRQRTEGRQIPWESTSLEDEFHFDSGLQVAVPADSSIREAAFRQEKADWDRVSGSKNVQDFYEFLGKYPNGNISELALARVEQLQASKVAPQPDHYGEVQHDWRSRFREGDRYDFVFKDGLTGVVRHHASVLIKLTGNDEVEGVGTGMPNTRSIRGEFVLQDGSGTYDPPWPVVPGGSAFQVGQTSSTRSIRTAPNGTKIWVDFKSRIVGRETVTVPVGIVNAHKVVVDVTQQTGRRGKYTFWFDAAWGHAVKAIFEFRDDRSGRDITIREMTSRKRGS